MLGWELVSEPEESHIYDQLHASEEYLFICMKVEPHK